MYSNIRTFSSDNDLVQERREHIRKCATALFVKQPFDESNMRQIMKACGMSKGGLYHYVGSKEDIRALIIEHAANAYIDAHRTIRNRVEGLSATEALRESISFLCQWMDTFQDEMIVIVHEGGNLSKEEREPLLHSERQNVAFIEEILLRGIEAEEFEISDPKMVAHTTYLAIRAWAERRWYLRKFYSLEEYVERLVEFIIKAAIKVGINPAIESKEGRRNKGTC